jgi:hypothetical protein
LAFAGIVAAVSPLSAEEPKLPTGQAYFERGLDYARRGEVDKAIGDFTEAIRRSDNSHLRRDPGVFLGQDPARTPGMLFLVFATPERYIFSDRRWEIASPENPNLPEESVNRSERILWPTNPTT